jgi:hypothetical protein
MGTDHADDEPAAECSSSDSFTDHGIERGSQLVSGTHTRLADAGIEFEPTADFFDRLEEAFIWAYLGNVHERGVPDHVETAIIDAKATTRERFSDAPDADLRVDVVPAFYQSVAGFHCAYRE